MKENTFFQIRRTLTNKHIRMIGFKNHHFVIPNEIIDLGKDYQYMPKSSDASHKGKNITLENRNYIITSLTQFNLIEFFPLAAWDRCFDGLFPAFINFTGLFAQVYQSKIYTQ